MIQNPFLCLVGIAMGGIKKKNVLKMVDEFRLDVVTICLVIAKVNN